MKKIKVLLLTISIVLISLLLLQTASAILIPKYRTENQEGLLTAEYYNNAGGHDVLFLGDCEVYESYIPAVLYEQYGITSYVRGNAQQLVFQSYYLLEDTLRYEIPKAVVFNVMALKYGEGQKEAYNRMTLDGMKWSLSKINAINASMTEGETFLSYLFPLFRYHSRWSELTEEDFTALFTTSSVSFDGYLMQKEVVPMTSTRQGEELTDYQLPENAMNYLEKMATLCQQNGIELILVKAPTNSWQYYWYDEWDEQVTTFAEEHSITYYNFISVCDEIGINWSEDTYDAGVHLNVYGAEKLTTYFGRILQENHNLTDHRGEESTDAIWQKKIETYHKERDNE